MTDYPTLNGEVFLCALGSLPGYESSGVYTSITSMRAVPIILAHFQLVLDPVINSIKDFHGQDVKTQPVGVTCPVWRPQIYFSALCR